MWLACSLHWFIIIEPYGFCSVNFTMIRNNESDQQAAGGIFHHRAPPLKFWCNLMNMLWFVVSDESVTIRYGTWIFSGFFGWWQLGINGIFGFMMICGRCRCISIHLIHLSTLNYNFFDAYRNVLVATILKRPSMCQGTLQYFLLPQSHHYSTTCFIHLNEWRVTFHTLAIFLSAIVWSFNGFRNFPNFSLLIHFKHTKQQLDTSVVDTFDTLRTCSTFCIHKYLFQCVFFLLIFYYYTILLILVYNKIVEAGDYEVCGAALDEET